MRAAISANFSESGNEMDYNSQQEILNFLFPGNALIR